MNYKQGFATAARFVGSEGILSRIRAVPASGTYRARLYANDGQVGVLCELDEGLDLPNVTFDAKMMLKITKEGDITSITQVNYGGVEVMVGATKYNLEDCAQALHGPAAYPGFPPMPHEWEPEPGWKVVRKVFHAVSKSADDPALQCVCFRPGLVQVTDKQRIVRAKTDGKPKSGLVPARVFKNWPAREVFSSFTHSTAFFRLGTDELRMAVLARDNFPDMTGFVPDEHKGADAVMALADMRRVVKRASDLSPMNLVRLEFGFLKGLKVTAWNEQPQTFVGTVACEVFADLNIVVSGKMLLEAFDEVDTPNVWIGYSKSDEPLRIEGPGGYIELIWPYIE